MLSWQSLINFAISAKEYYSNDAPYLYPLMSKEDKKSYSEGKKSYAGLSKEDKQQYHIDWTEAHLKTLKANSTHQPQHHIDAANAHYKAAKSAPHSIRASTHTNVATGHKNKVKILIRGANGKSELLKNLPEGWAAEFKKQNIPGF